MSVELVRDPAGRLALQLDQMRPEPLGLFDPALQRRGAAGRGEPLLKALGSAKRVVDATAGLGRDTALMLAAGLEVTALEQQPMLVELWREARAVGLTFVEGDALLALPKLSADAAVLDPMFPAGSYRGQVKRPSQILRALEAPDVEGARELLRLARERFARVVVKRPKGAEVLDAPSYVIEAGVTRFDVYRRARQPGE